jgi:hypothetical protein
MLTKVINIDPVFVNLISPSTCLLQIKDYHTSSNITSSLPIYQVLLRFKICLDLFCSVVFRYFLAGHSLHMVIRFYVHQLQFSGPH